LVIPLTPCQRTLKREKPFYRDGKKDNLITLMRIGLERILSKPPPVFPTKTKKPPPFREEGSKTTYWSWKNPSKTPAKFLYKSKKLSAITGRKVFWY
jgi:hypothetical protein